MKRALILAALAVTTIIHTAAASDAENTERPAEMMSDADAHHAALFVKDGLLLNVAMHTVQTKGLRALEPFAPDFSQALKTGTPVMQAIYLGKGKAVVLADGPAQTLMALLTAPKTLPPNSDVSAVPSPYLMMSMILGSYYNEIGNPSEALEALNLGIKLSDIDSMGAGLMDSGLISEKGAALNALKRFDEALATYQKGLALHVLKDTDKARLYRGQGFALGEMGKLDEAEKAYHTSLACEPDNPHALNELKYIAQLRAGRPPEPGMMQNVLPAENNGSDNGQCPKTL